MVTFTNNGLEKFRMKQAPAVPGSIADRIANASYTYGMDTRDVMQAPRRTSKPGSRFQRSAAFSPESLQDPVGDALLKALPPTLRLEAEQIAREAMREFGEGGTVVAPSRQRMLAAVKAVMQSRDSELVHMFGVGPTELIIMGIIAVLLFGKRLPGVMKGFGQGLREFKNAVSGVADEMKIDTNQPAEPEEEGGGDGTETKKN